MEKKNKYAAITAIISIGFFITIIAIAGLLLFHPDSDSLHTSNTTAPDNRGADTNADTNADTLFNPYDYFQNLPEVAEQSGTAEDATANKTETGTTAAVDASATSNAAQQKVQQKVQQQPSKLNTAVANPSPVVHSARNASQKHATANMDSSAPRTTAAAAKSTVPAAKSAVASASHTKNTPSTAGNAAPSATHAVRTYWVQLFSSDKHERTDRAQATLAKYQIDGIISDHNINGTRYYRLRIGPYTEYREAQKFLAWLNQGNVFSNGYVVQSN